MCSFEGTSYLLCGLQDSNLLNFILNASNGELAEMKKVPLGVGTDNFRLNTLSSKKGAPVLALSDRLVAIYGGCKKLLYSNVNLTGVNHVCAFKSETPPYSLAFAKNGTITIGTIDDIEEYQIHSASLGKYELARRICHQNHSRTFAICSSNCLKSYTGTSEMHKIHLLDEQTLEIRCTHHLAMFENAYSIISCSFDNVVYCYCVGTGFEMPKDNEISEGQILLFLVEEGKLRLIVKMEVKGPVFSLNAFNGKLLVGMNQSVVLYRLVLEKPNGPYALAIECEQGLDTLPVHLHTRGNVIYVGDLMKSLSRLTYIIDKGIPLIEKRT